MGRPKLAPDELREIDVCVALNAKEYAVIEARAKAAKKRIAEYLRLRGVNDKSLKIVPEINRDAAQQIREILNLLSQIAFFVQQGELTVLDPIFFSEMDKELRQMHEDFLNHADH